MKNVFYILLFIFLLIIQRGFSKQQQTNQKLFHLAKTDQQVFFSENYCGIVVYFEYLSSIEEKIIIHINSTNILIPFQLANSIATAEPSCPHFENLEPPELIEELPTSLKMSVSESNRHFFIIFYSRFANNISFFEGSIDFFLQNMGLVQTETINQSLSDNILLDDFDLFIPASVEEGQQYHNKFYEAQFMRNLSFNRNPPNQVDIYTQERSGTHMVARTIEDITEKWVSMFANLENGTFKYQQSDQLVQNATPYTKLNIMHYSKRDHIIRKMNLIRDRINATESLYHKNRNKLIHNKKLKGEYWKNPEYLEFFEKKLIQNTNDSGIFYVENSILRRQPVIRYEDILMDPTTMFTKILSFTLGYPIEHTKYRQAMMRVIKEQGLSSFYKNLSVEDIKNIRQNKKTLDLLPADLIKSIYVKYQNYIHYFGYEKDYEYYIKKHKLQVDTQPMNFTSNYYEDLDAWFNNFCNRKGFEKSNYIKGETNTTTN